MSPYSYSGNEVMFTISRENLYHEDVRFQNAIRPVITLKPRVLVSRSGTTNNPFVPSL